MLHFSNTIFLKENDTNILKYEPISAWKIPRLSSHVYCFYYFYFCYFITSHVYCFFFKYWFFFVGVESLLF